MPLACPGDRYAPRCIARFPSRRWLPRTSRGHPRRGGGRCSSKERNDPPDKPGHFVEDLKTLAR